MNKENDLIFEKYMKQLKEDVTQSNLPISRKYNPREEYDRIVSITTPEDVEKAFFGLTPEEQDQFNKGILDIKILEDKAVEIYQGARWGRYGSR